MNLDDIRPGYAELVSILAMFLHERGLYEEAVTYITQVTEAMEDY